MEIEIGGSRSAEMFDLVRGKKRPASPASSTSDEDDEWMLSDSGSEEDEENQVIFVAETHRPFTVAEFPRVTCDHEQQTNLLYRNPETKLRGPRAVRLYNPLKTGKLGFAADYNIADQSEMSVRDVGDCSNECRCLPMDLLQFVSANIAGYEHTRSGPAKICGFVAARDTLNPLRNYVYRRKINNCEAVTVKPKTGLARLSLISPARVISFSTRVLIEFELQARSDEETDGDNGSIIEGCTELYNMDATESFAMQNRVYGERCALDIKYLVLINALEACVEVKVLSLGATPGGIDMKLCAKSSGFKEVIRLFQGAAPDPGETMSFIVAVENRKIFDLYIEGSARDDQKLLPLSWRCSFTAGYHVMNENVAKLGELATVSVKRGLPLAPPLSPPKPAPLLHNSALLVFITADAPTVRCETSLERSECPRGSFARTHRRCPSIPLGFVEEDVKKTPMETDEGGGLTATTPVHEPCRKRPYSLTSPDDDDEDEWFVSDSEDEDDEVEGTYSPFTVDDIPRPSCDFKANPDAKRRGPLPTMLFPAFKFGNHVFDYYYNLADKSEISVRDVENCLNECRCCSMNMLQFIDIKIAGYRHTRPGRAQLFGFIAARETDEPLRNFVYKREIKNSEAVFVKQKTGVARLTLTSPSRAISMPSHVLIEFELHAHGEDQGDDDLIIEGCTEFEYMHESKSFMVHRRLYGEKCALDMKFLRLINAVEARVDVEVLRLGAYPDGINLKVYAKTSGFDEVIRLFRGAAPDPGSAAMSFVVVAERRGGFDLYIEAASPILGQKPKQFSWWQRGFLSAYHETVEEVATLGEFATVSVKITWRTYRKFGGRMSCGVELYLVGIGRSGLPRLFRCRFGWPDEFDLAPA
ncbi:hypothetical protein EJB05_00889 [Eragrostis curvula]|uniref:DUF6598 domain-containing protein n=1 Tax=Eragrostis curvula TaxID=38414 RepID=A0A5J9WNM3_9POAL|nr:hypothetical protein EJB05_00889 [Eragrostis curvula]